MGCKTRDTAALCLDVELVESCQDLWPMQRTAAGVEKEESAPAPLQDTPVSAHRKSVLAKVKQLMVKHVPDPQAVYSSRPCWSRRQGELLGCPTTGIIPTRSNRVRKK